MYQGYVDLESNLAFSPLGYAALLAILAEGARGDTRDQLVNALHLPGDPQVTRIAYKTVLERLNVSNDI
jgi:serine protease inhibitor